MQLSPLEEKSIEKDRQVLYDISTYLKQCFEAKTGKGVLFPSGSGDNTNIVQQH